MRILKSSAALLVIAFSGCADTQVKPTNSAAPSNSCSTTHGAACYVGAGSPMYVAYVPKLVRAIRSHTFYDGAIPEGENPLVDYRIELFPDGTVTSIVLKQSSGYPTFDESVRRGILRTSPLPTRDDGKSELRIEIRFKMKS